MKHTKIIISLLALLLTSNSWSMGEGNFFKKFLSRAMAAGRSLIADPAANPIAELLPENRVINFIYAAQQGNLKVVQDLLPYVDVNAQEPTHKACALIMASQNGHQHVVEFLLECEGIDCNIRSSLGHTPLRQASQGGHLEVVKALVKAKAHVNARTNNGDTALMAASEQGRAEVVNFLLQNGARDGIDWPDNKENTPLHAAASHNQVPVVKALLEAKAKPLVYNNANSLPIHIASLFGYDEIVDMLLHAAPESVNSHGPDGATCLRLASQEGRFEIVQALVAAKADVELLDDINYSALTGACEKGHFEVVEFLLRHGAQKTIHVIGKEGVFCLRQAAQRGNPRVITLLLENGAQAHVNQPDTKGITPVFVASFKGHTSCVEQLIAAKADATIATNQGYLPLHAACENGHLAAIRILIDAAPHTIDACPDGIMTPLKLAMLQKKTDVVTLLLEKKANPELKYRAHNGALQTLHLEICGKEWVLSWATSIQAEEEENPAGPEESETRISVREDSAQEIDSGSEWNGSAGENGWFEPEEKKD
jgi:ankyrin repeat protein